MMRKRDMTIGMGADAMPLSESDRLSILRVVPFFAALSDSDLHQVYRLAAEQQFQSGQRIFDQGEQGEHLYIIASGHVRISLSGSDGRAVTLGIYGRNAIFGEFAVLDGEPRSAHAIAMTPVTTLVLDRSDFAGLRAQFPAISEGVITVLLSRLRISTTFGQNIAFLSAVGKIATTLAQLAASLGDGTQQVTLPYDQNEIALMAGVAYEWVNKAYQDIFVPNRMIALSKENGQVIVLDSEQLRQWEHPDGPRRADLAGACAYAQTQLAKLPKMLTYHSISHTRDDVVPAAEELALALGCSQYERELLLTAAWFHDIGYLETRIEHEEASIRVVERVLPGYGYTRSDIDQINAIIRATRVPQQPKTLLDQILVDADLVSLGRNDYMKQSMALYEELIAVGQQIELAAWVQGQLAFISGHEYLTEPARQSGDPGKLRNLDRVRQLLASGG
jgi:uncharacterized protein